ncbi:MAG: hypothetical protein JXR83_11780 [Deltaproteobacteria bacterium]|nr:hypothetical protein [Deltaproteobacteria bacterium]
MTEHSTELDLELLRTGEADPAIARHVAGCAQCRDRLARLERDARALAMPLAAIEVPAECDRAILALARRRAGFVAEQLERRRRPRWLRPLYAAVPLAAAASIIFFVTLQRGAQAPQATAPLAAAATGDINRDGRVDIVDALLLARALKSDQPHDPAWDQNRDGRVDQADVDRIAQAAVSLQRRHP